MDFSTALSTDLKNLLRSLDLPGVDVARCLDALRLNLRLVVDSFAGLVVTVVVHGQPVTVTSLEVDGRAQPITSSLRLPLESTAGIAPGSVLVLYARSPDAFADLARGLALLAGGLVLDADLTTVPSASGVTGLQELAVLSRATGVLLDLGVTAEEAAEHLASQAAATGRSVPDVAAGIVRAV